jgi:hypothetical protein
MKLVFTSQAIIGSFAKSLALRLGCLKARLMKEEENHEIFRY